MNGIQTHNFSGYNIGTDCTGSCKSNYHTITYTKAPFNLGGTEYQDKTTDFS